MKCFYPLCSEEVEYNDVYCKAHRYMIDKIDR